MQLSSPLRISLFALAVFLCGATEGWTLPVTFQWPEGLGGAYKVHGLAEQPLTETKTFDAPEGKSVRVTGPGFDFSFLVEKDAVTFPKPLLKNKMGVRFERKTNAFFFVAAEVTLDAKDCDEPVDWEGVAWPATGEKQSGNGVRNYKVVYGHHRLKYPGGNVAFSVDEHGTVTLEDKVAGMEAQGAKLTIQGTPLSVTGKDPGWQVVRITQPAPEASGTVRLLPNDNGYSWQSGGTIRANVSFFLSSAGQLSTRKDGPYQEFITLTDKNGAALGTMAIPNGEALYNARIAQEKGEKERYDRVWASSATAEWKKDFSLVDAMQFYNFPEQQVSYPLDLPADVKASALKLLAFEDGAVRSVPFEILETPEGGKRIYFRAGLPKGGSHLYRLVEGFEEKDLPALTYKAPSLLKSEKANEAVLENGKIRLTVPAGHQDFAGGIPLAKAPAPIIAAARGDIPVLTGSFTAPDTLRVKTIDAKVVRSGLLAMVYEIAYTLQGGKSYRVKLELRANEGEVAIDETIERFRPEEGAALRLDYGQGLNPNRRLVGAYGGYDAYSGDYSKSVSPSGKLNYVLSLYTPNSIGLARATAFYNESGQDALLLAITRPRDWVTSKRAIWGSTSLPENLTFYAQGADKFLLAALAGTKRYWTLGLIPRNEATMLAQDGVDAPASGPEVRMLNRLTDWSLDKYKDRLTEWNEKLAAAPFDAKDFNAEGGFTPISYEDYVKNYFVTKTFFRWVRNDSWDFSSENSPVSFRDMPELFGQYAVSRGTWTPEQRAQARQVLLFMADSSEDDANLPHHSMLAGHPNFVMDVKTVLPLAAATFPNHPKSKMWRDSFMGFYNEWLDQYSRKDVPELNTTGGRWVENIAAYVGQCFVGLLDSQKALKAYDGTSLAQNSQLLAVIRWMRDAFMSPNDGVRMIPPQGAHARAFEPGQKFYNTFFQLCAAIAPDAPELAQEMKWIETNGKEGQKPEVRSRLFTDYGPVLHYDFGGSHESYAHMQLLFGSNYRWGNAGIVYYGARNEAWSYNNEDTNGDDFSWNNVTAFTVNGKGLKVRPVDQLLYDFDFAQFYRQPGENEDPYKARAMMMVRDDYLVLSDEVAAADTPGKFRWASSFGQPEIYQLKPGVAAVESEAHDKMPRRKEQPEDRVCHIRTYSGTGDFLTVVAPEAVKAEAKPYGALVKGEYVFAEQAPVEVKEGPVEFAGTYGYARPNQLALFQGTSIGLDGFTVRRDGGDFGISAVAEKNRISGRLVGRSGGRVWLTPPAGADLSKATVTVDGRVMAHTVENGAVAFPVEIAQRDGTKSYELTWPGSP